MSGLRYRNLGPFSAGRKMKLAGVDYAPGEPIPADVVAGLRHLDALLSNNFIRPAQGPYTKTGKQAQHVPTGVRAELATVAKSLEQILAWVGDDVDRAQRALYAEQELDGGPRSAVVIALEDIISPPTIDDVPDGTVNQVLAWVGASVLRATVALEVENAKETPRSTLVDALEAIIDPQTH